MRDLAWYGLEGLPGIGHTIYVLLDAPVYYRRRTATFETPTVLGRCFTACPFQTMTSNTVGCYLPFRKDRRQFRPHVANYKSPVTRYDHRENPRLALRHLSPDGDVSFRGMCSTRYLAINVRLHNVYGPCRTFYCRSDITITNRCATSRSVNRLGPFRAGPGALDPRLDSLSVPPTPLPADLARSALELRNALINTAP